MTRTPPVSWPEMVGDPVRGGMRMLANQIADRDDFIEKKGLTREFRAWLSRDDGAPPVARGDEVTEVTNGELSVAVYTTSLGPANGLLS